jgi:hypothetical protein
MTVLLALCVPLFLLAFALWLRLRPMAGEWTVRVPLVAGASIEIGVPRLIEAATDPAIARWLHRRTLASPLGRLRFTWQRESETLVARCAPCTLRVAALGSDPIVLDSATLSVRRDGDRRLRGTLASGEVVLLWRAALTKHDLRVEGELDPTRIATLVALFGPQVPELSRARIDGTLAARWRLAWPGGRVGIEPAIDGFEVSGLGTGALVGAVPPPRCAPPPSRELPWLERAVVAAEDQRFYEHPGYDLDAIVAAFGVNQRDGEVRGGASTLTQQLAKLVYTGDERSAVRKLRELLYAVEMERTLGKARILALYLALAPWGDGTCGAEQAARRRFGKPAHRLDAIEAAWLAARLRDPDGADDLDRVAFVLQGMARGERQRERWDRRMREISLPGQTPAGDAP